MKRKALFSLLASLGLLCALLIPAPAVTAADNLAVNGDLEMGSVNGWETPAAQIDTSVVHSGNYSLKLTATAAYEGAAFKVVPVRKNATVTVSFDYRYASNPGGQLYHVYTYKGSNPWVGAYTGADASLIPSATVSAWQRASYTFNCGDYDAIYLKFCPGGSGSSPCYIDNLTVTAEGGDRPDVDPYLTSFGTKYNRPVSAAANLIANGGFESAVGAEWNTATFIKGALSVVEDATAPEGSHSLCFKGGASPAWHTFPVAVEPHTQYTFSAWVKSPRLSGDNRATATCGVMNAATNEFLVYAPYNGNGNGAASLSTGEKQLMATAPDDAWHLRSVTFDSGSHSTVNVAVYGADSVLYLDAVALYRSSDGVEYISPLRADTIDGGATDGNRYCADEDSLIEGIYMTTNDARLSWSDNPAWRNGFLSFTDVGDSHGAVLQYTASAHTEWQLHYINWIDVEPHTSYTLTLDVKRVAAGGGRIALLDDNVLAPAEFYTLSFDSVDSDWVTYSVTFDSGVYARIGFAIVDGGGSALIDEVRLFETAKGIADRPADPTLTLYPVPIGTSVMEMDGDKLGVAFLIEQEGYRIHEDDRHRVDLSTATVIPWGNGQAYPLLRMGAVITNDAAVGMDAERMVLSNVNGAKVVDVPVVYLWSASDTGCQYAVRVVNVPPDRRDTPIFARPYYVFEKDGEEITVYGEITARSYNG